MASSHDEALLRLKFRDLSLDLEQSGLQVWIDTFISELLSKRVPLNPIFYFGDEWFSPQDRVAISIPFFLAHPRLRELERKMMRWVEGEEEAYFLKLLRHEAGHCLDHAFQVSRTKKWQKIFGSPRRNYSPDCYRADPSSKSFVQNLDHHYAQAHPEEDFAETFAVWLDPASRWRLRYRQRPVALAKLQYVDDLVEELRCQEHKSSGRRKSFSRKSMTRLPYDVRNLRTTLGVYYRRRLREAFHNTLG